MTFGFLWELVRIFDITYAKHRFPYLILNQEFCNIVRKWYQNIIRQPEENRVKKVQYLVRCAMCNQICVIEHYGRVMPRSSVIGHLSAGGSWLDTRRRGCPVNSNKRQSDSLIGRSLLVARSWEDKPSCKRRTWNNSKIMEDSIPTWTKKIYCACIPNSSHKLPWHKKLNGENKDTEALTLKTSDVFVFVLLHPMISHHRHSSHCWLRDNFHAFLPEKYPT